MKMRIHMAVLMVAVLAFLPAVEADARASKAERLNDVAGEMNRLLEVKATLAENEAYANDHPDEAKRCFDPMMETADKHGVERHVYFTEHQDYFRECIEQQVSAKNE